MRSHESSGKYEAKTLLPDEIDTAAAQTGHSNSDIRNNWRQRAEAGGLVMFALKDGEDYVASVNLLLDGADEQIVKDEIGIIPMVNALGVNDSHRKQGIATKLMDVCENYVRLHTDLPQKIVLGVEVENEVARNMYEKLGYTYLQIAGEATYESSWPEINEDGKRVMYVTRCLLMEKDL